MAELFTHVLAGFIIATIASWRYEWITPPLVVACMVGAAIPDLNRIRLIVPADTITALTGLPWSLGITHRGGGALLIALILTLLVAKDYRKPVFALLCVGIASHLIIDYFLWQPTGTTNLMLWPFADITIDYQGFYRSSDRWTAVVSILLAGIVLGIDRFVITRKSSASDDPSSLE